MSWLIILFLSQNVWADSCADKTGCEVLKCELERDIAEAKRQGQPLRAQDMQETLDRHNRNCTSAKKSVQSSNLEQQVDQRRQEVQDAKDFGNPIKEQKKQLRLDEEMAELEKMRTKSP